MAKSAAPHPPWSHVVAMLKDLSADEIRESLLRAVAWDKKAVACQNSCGETLLHYAARAHRVDILRLLVEEFAGDVNSINKHGRQPIHEGIDDPNTVDYLLSAGADHDSIKRGDWSALHSAALKGNLSVIKVLVRAGADIHHVTKDGWTPLHLATMKGHADAVRYFLLLNLQAWNNRTTSGRLPLHTAASSGFSELVHLFLFECPPPERGGLFGVDKGGMGVIHYACIADGDRVEMVKECGNVWKAEAAAAWRLLEPHSRENTTDFVDPVAYPDPWILPDAIGRCPLHLAAMAGNAAVVRYLVSECDVDVNSRDSWDFWTPVFFAVKEGHTDVVKILRDSGCDLEEKDRIGRAPLDLGEPDALQCCREFLHVVDVPIRSKLPNRIALRRRKAS